MPSELDSILNATHITVPNRLCLLPCHTSKIPVMSKRERKSGFRVSRSKAKWSVGYFVIMRQSTVFMKQGQDAALRECSVCRRQTSPAHNAPTHRKATVTKNNFNLKQTISSWPNFCTKIKKKMEMKLQSEFPSDLLFKQKAVTHASRLASSSWRRAHTETSAVGNTRVPVRTGARG